MAIIGHIPKEGSVWLVKLGARRKAKAAVSA